LRRGPFLAYRGLLILLAILAFACGALAVALWREHARADCWQAAVEEDLPQQRGDCR